MSCVFEIGTITIHATPIEINRFTADKFVMKLYRYINMKY